MEGIVLLRGREKEGEKREREGRVREWNCFLYLTSGYRPG